MQVPKPILTEDSYRGRGHPTIPFDRHCQRCSLYKARPVGGAGPNDLSRVRLLVVSDYPGHYEVEAGYPFAVVNDEYRCRARAGTRWANAGALLRHGLLTLGLNSYTDCWLTNAVKCAPKGEGKVTLSQTKPCAQYWLKPEVTTVLAVRPDLPIWIAGSLALRVFCQTFDWDVPAKVNELRRRVHFYYQHPVVVTWNPAVYTRSEFREVKSLDQPRDVYPIFRQPLILSPLWMFYQDIAPLKGVLSGHPTG